MVSGTRGGDGRGEWLVLETTLREGEIGRIE